MFWKTYIIKPVKMKEFSILKFFVKINPILRNINKSIFFVKITPVCQDNPCQDTANTGVYETYLFMILYLA